MSMMGRNFCTLLPDCIEGYGDGVMFIKYHNGGNVINKMVSHLAHTLLTAPKTVQPQPTESSLIFLVKCQKLRRAPLHHMQ